MRHWLRVWRARRRLKRTRAFTVRAVASGMLTLNQARAILNDAERDVREARP